MFITEEVRACMWEDLACITPSFRTLNNWMGAWHLTCI